MAQVSRTLPSGKVLTKAEQEQFEKVGALAHTIGLYQKHEHDTADLERSLERSVTRFALTLGFEEAMRLHSVLAGYVEVAAKHEEGSALCGICGDAALAVLEDDFEASGLSADLYAVLAN